MKTFISFLLVFALIANSRLFAQDSLRKTMIIPNGILLEYGIGSYAITDEYISKEKYSGTFPYFTAGWANHHENYVYHIRLNFRYSSEIANYKISANVMQFALNQEFLYPLADFSLFSKKIWAYIGPSTEIFAYANKQNIAISGFDYSKSYAALFSLGLSSAFFCSLAKYINIESFLNFSALSVGWRLIDMEESDESDFKFLTLFSGIHGAFTLGIRYYLIKNLSLRAAYVFTVTRINAWNPLLSASDNIVFNLTFGL